MKTFKKIIFLPIISLLILLCSCDALSYGSVKELTHPYINQYECTKATLGNKDLLENFEYIKLIFIDTKELELSFKNKGGERKVYNAPYAYDEQKGEIEVEFGIFGAEKQQRAKIESGKIILTKIVLGMPLIVIFEVK